MQRDKQRAFAVEALGNDEVVGVENLAVRTMESRVRKPA
jgi:hypothetical protein